MSEPESELGDDSETHQSSKKNPRFIYAVVGQGLFSLTRLASSILIGGRFGAGELGTGSKEELGTYLAYFSILLLCISVLEAFVTIPMTFLMHSKHGQERKKFSSFLLLVCGVMSLVVCAVCLVVGFSLRFSYEAISAEILIAFTVLIATQFVREFLVRWVLAQLDSQRYAVIELLYFAIYIPLLAALLFLNSLSIASLFICMAAINVVVIALWWKWYSSEFINLFSRNATNDNKEGSREQPESLWSRFGPTLKEQVYFGRWIAADSVCSLATVYFCNWYLLLKIGSAGAGVYGACMTIVLLVNPFLNGVMSMFAPISAVEYEQGGKLALTKVMFKYGIPLLVVMIAFSAFLFFAGDWLTVKFFGNRYSEFFASHYNGENRITFLIGLSMPLTTIAYVLACGVMASGKPKYTFFSSAVGLVSLLILCSCLREPDLEQCAICFSIAIGLMAVARTFFYIRSCNE